MRRQCPKAHFNNPINVEAIVKIYISKSFTKDERIWPLSKNGQLITKSAYRLICSIDGANLVSILVNQKDLWRFRLPQRVLIFGRKCFRNIILVRTIVKSKISSLHDTSPICGKEEDSIGHALVHCDSSRVS